MGDDIIDIKCPVSLHNYIPVYVGEDSKVVALCTKCGHFFQLIIGTSI